MSTNTALGVKVIGLDADDTLWPTVHLYNAALEEFVARFGSDHTQQDDLLVRHGEHVERYGYGALAFQHTLLSSAIAAISDPATLAECAAWAVRTCETIHEDSATPFDGVEESLTALKAQGLVLAVITKGSNAEQYRKIVRSGLSRLFDAQIVLASKSREQYASVVGQLSPDPSQFLMVGDSLMSDIEPVLEIGGKAVWVKHDGSEHWEDEGYQLPAGVAVIRSLPELVPLLTGNPPPAAPPVVPVVPPSPPVPTPTDNAGDQTEPPRTPPLQAPATSAEDDHLNHPALNPAHRNREASESLNGLRGGWRKHESGQGWEVQIEGPPQEIGTQHEVFVFRKTGEHSRRIVSIVGDGNTGWVIGEDGSPSLLYT